MEIRIKIEPNQWELYGHCVYNAEDIATSHFLLNRDFRIDSLKVDGCEVSPYIEKIELDDSDGYIVHKISLPANFENLQVDYSGMLTGKTGCNPYVRERITPEFTFIRWETFCYPLFSENTKQQLAEYLLKPGGESQIVIDVPAGYDVVASEKLTYVRDVNGRKQYVYSGTKYHSHFFNCSCAKYHKSTLPTGSFYLLNSNDASTLINETMVKAHGFLNQHFGERDIASNIVYAAIPDGFGSFACSEAGVVYVQQSTLKSIHAMNEIIHEFIHLGWNVPADRSQQSIRFFDEAFTSYFEMRVMEYLTKESRVPLYASLWKDRIGSGSFKLVPICEFGQRGYGDQSYTIGALCLHELCELIGTARFDEITTTFLEKYKSVPVTLDVFCQEYANLADEVNKPVVEQFFEDWIYSCKGYAKYL
ncbi:hypothetical protein ACFQ3W_24590 [Paenibacillus puldeungensis]|uniref:Peptidase M1 membrane alanine aminopeptidase domain-containing protein n=1 Tax=Paenibacillus puldeungensis TaxID=696536 RepID=A0ABW3S4F0_9BACL